MDESKKNHDSIRKKISKPNIGKGDYGFTEFIGVAMAYKSSWQAEACGTIDELNACIGEAYTRIEKEEIRKDLLQISKDLFVLGSEVASTMMTDKKNLPQITPDHIHRLEERIVHYEAMLLPLRHFILPMGPPMVTILHQARAICRRSERQMVHFLKETKEGEKMNPLTLAYLNRLSDVLFALTRHLMKETHTPEVYWSRENI